MREWQNALGFHFRSSCFPNSIQGSKWESWNEVEDQTSIVSFQLELISKDATDRESRTELQIKHHFY
jgi:hypothetical protein